MTSTLEDWWRILHKTHRAVAFSTEQCRRLASTGRVGRLLMSGPSGPRFVLTEYVWHADRIFLPTALAARLGDDIDGRRVAFEIDELDVTETARPRGWSVVGAGTAWVVPALAAWVELASSWGAAGFPARWPPGDADQPLVRLDVDCWTGHEVNSGW